VADPLQFGTTGFTARDPGGNEMGIWGRRVVAIDDDADSLQLLARILREKGAEVVPVDQPGGALNTILGVVPDLLLVDVAMPGLDGLTLIRKLRSLSPERGGRVPAATLTAFAATGEDLARWRAAGFQRHVAKPFEPAAILTVVDELAGFLVERRAASVDRRDWPTVRDRRTELRIEISTGSSLRGVAGGNEQILRELALADGDLTVGP
jgi:CheY-like chemotaxis protein